MAHDAGRSERDAALRAVLVQQANASHTTRRGAAHGAPVAGKHLPVLATAIVLAAVVPLSVGAIAASHRLTAASLRFATSAPAAPPAASSSGPSSSGASGVALIAMKGAQALTRAQLHAWTVANQGTSANAAIGEEQDWLTIQCMASHGYLYDPTFDGAQGLELGKTWGLTAKQLQGYRLALWGTDLTNSNQPYDWHDAGCHGRAVHLTGQDNNH